MSDDEVGKLWASIPRAGNDSAPYWQYQCKQLIEKLIAERMLYYQVTRSMHPDDAHDKTLREFGISDA